MRRLAVALVLALAGCATAPRPAPAPEALRAGVARVSITPPRLGWLSGYGSRGTKVAERAEHDLRARALALEDGAGARAVLVTADLLGFGAAFDGALRAAARARFGLEDAALMVVASHTHGGPVMPERPSPEIFLGLDEAQRREVDAYGALVRERLLEAIGRALADLAPARLARGRSEARFGVNRRQRQPDGTVKLGENPDGPIDPEVPVLRVEGEDGRLRALVFGYACHGTTLGDVMVLHGDFVSYATERLEADVPGAVALFVTGAAGDINPSPRGRFEDARVHGEALAAAVRAALAGPLAPVTGPFRGTYRRIELPLAEPPPRALLERLREDASEHRRRHAAAMLALADAGRLPRAVPLPIQTWRFGAGLTLVALGGEVTVEYALRLKRELGPVWVAAYANEVPCYVPSEKVLAEGGYEAGWSPRGEGGRTVAAGNMLYYGWPGPLAPGIEDRIVRTVHDSLGR